MKTKKKTLDERYDNTHAHTQTLIFTHTHTYIYRVSQEDVPDFERVFLMLKYTDTTQNTYVQS